MKIPETPNVGAYYGNEENGQWQPNGVIIDSGVGGGVVGSGDAGFVHNPAMYPVPRPHMPMPGYVMTGPYYTAPHSGGYPPQGMPPTRDDFADYMWMENEEEFDKQVMQQLEEEALMEQCIEAMLEDEQRERHHRPVANGHTQQYPQSSNGASISLEEAVSRSTLNPLAAEFVPTRLPSTSTALSNTVSDEKDSIPEVSASQEVHTHKHRETETDTSTVAPTATQEAAAEEHKTEDTKSETPEVSAADVQPIKEVSQERRPKAETKAKAEAKRPLVSAKAEAKKTKPVIVKSEPKLPAKKDVSRKEVKPVRSDTRVEEHEPVVVPEMASDSFPSLSSSAEESAPSGPKPINYAAAARANKPKKAGTPPATEKSAPPPVIKAEKSLSGIKLSDKSDKPAKTIEKLAATKDKVKVAEKPRKNSAK